MDSRLREAVLKKASETENAFYLYDQKNIISRTERLKRDFPSAEFLYSVKANPFPPVLRTVQKQGFGFDAASLSEVQKGAELGLPKEKIFYSAPGKSEQDIRKALGRCILVADSVNELKLISRIASERGIAEEIGVRISPKFTFETDQGLPSKFGIDEEQLFSLDFSQFPYLKFTGIHVHVRSQELRSEVLQSYYSKVFGLAARCAEKLGMKLDFINLGGGLGTVYAGNSTELDTGRLGRMLTAQTEQLKKEIGQTPRILIETGRFAASDAGTFVTRVMDVKESRGVKFVIVRNTLNGFIRPSLSALVSGYAKNDPDPKACEPLFTKKNAFSFELLTDEKETETVTVCGNLCTAADVMAAGIRLPRAEVGDVLAVSDAGSYAYVLSPVQFSFQTAPEQYLLKSDGELLTD